jgi:hypothetical protein
LNGGFILAGLAGYITDLTIVAILVVGITAFLGVITNGIGENLFGGKKKSEFVQESEKYQTGWKAVGGNKK